MSEDGTRGADRHPSRYGRRPPGGRRHLSRDFAAGGGITRVAPVAGEGRRLVHMRYDTAAQTAAGVRAVARLSGYPARLAGR